MTEQTIINFYSGEPSAGQKCMEFLKALKNWIRWSWRFKSFGWGTRMEGFVLLENADEISIGKNCEMRGLARLETYGPKTGEPKMAIGDNTAIQYFFHCSALVKVDIGNDVLIGGRVTIVDNDHMFDDPERSARLCPECVCAPVKVEDGVWIGEGAVVLKGVTVGERSVVAANAVVTKDVPPYSIVGGIPAKVIGTIDRNKKQEI